MFPKSCDCAGAGKLAAHGIAANVIAAYFHDHIFVQSELADRAVGILFEYSNPSPPPEKPKK